MRPPFVLSLLAVLVLAQPAGAATTFTVTDPVDGDAGHTCPGPTCNLRQAINAANGAAGADTIDFAIAPPGVKDLTITSGLPSLSESVVIDGSSELPGTPNPINLHATYSNTPAVLVFVGPGATSTIKGISIYDESPGGAGPTTPHPNAGISVFGDVAPTTLTLEDVTIGVGDGGENVGIKGGAGVKMVGTGLVATGVVVGNSAGPGISIDNALSGDPGDLPTTIVGSRIGVNAAGTVAAPNQGDGLYVRTESPVTVGGAAPSERNVISANEFGFGSDGEAGGGGGVHVVSGGVAASTAVRIEGNSIGADVSGNVAMSNARDGIELVGGDATHVLDLVADSNVLSGRGCCNAVSLRAGVTGDVTDNFVGLSATGAQQLGPGAARGILVAENSVPVTIDGNTVSGNAVMGIDLAESRAIDVTGNFIGTGPTGDALPSAPQQVLGIVVGGGDVTIGGAGAAQRNVISGNLGTGVDVTAAGTDIQVLGNRIGTDAAGAVAVPNAIGVSVHGSSGRAVEVGAPGAGNLVSGNSAIGVAAEATGTTVKSNVIGTNATQTAPLPNSGTDDAAVFVTGAATVGGTGPGEGNVIAGNAGFGVGIGANARSTHAKVLGNRIGLTSDGTPMGNAGGLGIRSAENQVGPLVGTVGENVIAGNHGPGVLIFDGAQNTLGANSIFANDGLGIELRTGGNAGLAAPAIGGLTASGGGLTVTGTTTGPPLSVVSVRFFANDACDAGGAGEGKTYLGVLGGTTDAGGTAALSGSIPANVPPGTVVTATTTDELGNTSQFSACTIVAPEPPPPVPPAPVVPPFVPPVPPRPVALALSGFGVTPKTFTAKRGATLAFRVTKPAKLTFTVERSEKGRMSRGRCSPSAKKGKACVRRVSVRRFTRTVTAAGAQTTKLDGTGLKPGSYRLLAVATAGAERSKTLAATFRVR